MSAENLRAAISAVRRAKEAAIEAEDWVRLSGLRDREKRLTAKLHARTLGDET